MLAIDLISDFQSLLREDACPDALPRETVLEVLESYKTDLGEDEFGQASVDARIAHFYEAKRAHTKHRHESNLEIFKIINAAGQSALRSIFITNGGASIALAAFLGTMMSAEESGAISVLLPKALFIFTLGTFFAALAFGLTYITMFIAGYDHEPKWKITVAGCLNCVTIVIGAASLLCFFLGILKSYHAFVG